jgi:penicillin-binding protein 1A
MLARKREEMRLSLWLEQEMRKRFGSKRRAKEEIFARYASFVYMGNGQYGFARAAEYYFGRPLTTFTVDDVDKAALLAGIAKSPRDYAPSAKDTGIVLRRRNQTLTLMRTNGFVSLEGAAKAKGRPLQIVRHDQHQMLLAPAVVEHVLQEFKARHDDLSVDDLLQGRIQVYATADARVQHIVNEALEHGLGLYEQRHPKAREMIQGSVVVLQNGDGRILAETGGRQIFKGRSASYSDYNRVTQALRQPGSAMKAIVYLAAFQHGGFTLETLVPDEPISVPDGGARPLKWISNYDGRLKICSRSVRRSPIRIKRNRGKVSAASLPGADAPRVPRQDRRGGTGVSGGDGRSHYGLPTAARSSSRDRRRWRCPDRPTRPAAPPQVEVRLVRLAAGSSGRQPRIPVRRACCGRPCRTFPTR